MAIDKRKIALSRVDNRELMAIVNFKGIFDNESEEAFCKLLGISVEDFTWDVSSHTAIKIREIVKEKRNEQTNNSVRGSVRVGRKRADRSVSSSKEASRLGRKGGRTKRRTHVSITKRSKADSPDDPRPRVRIRRNNDRDRGRGSDS